MGVDYRDWQKKDIPRSDTMILLTLDPVTKTAGMLSVPRDLWVNIPNYGFHKINEAYFLGESNHLPGGGPQLGNRNQLNNCWESPSITTPRWISALSLN